MSLTQKKKEDRAHFWIVMVVCSFFVSLPFILMHNNPKEQEPIDLGYRTVEDCASLELVGAPGTEQRSKMFKLWIWLH